MQQVTVRPRSSVPEGLDTSSGWLPPSTVSAMASAPLQHKSVQLGTVEAAHLTVLRYWFQPLVAVVTLFLCMLCLGEPGGTDYLALSLATLVVSRQFFGPLELQNALTGKALQPALSRLILEWSGVVLFLLVLGWSLHALERFNPRVIATWFALTPVTELIGSYLAGRIARQSRPAVHRHIIIGVNEIGLELARRAGHHACLGHFMGFFDFRSADRLPLASHEQLVGRCKDVPEFVRRNAIDAIYIALPISNAPRIEQLLQELRDTTASIYFVPNIFAFDLVQARCVEINGIPAFSICDTPFYGMNAVRKRMLDFVLACLGIAVLWPIMLAIAIAVKLSSPGPVLFKQRRYGLNGEQILVYKFRTMTVCEDGREVKQATRHDRRITPVGRLLRKTSLDELAQLFNVLAGDMSFVGPRPHAVAHNELYRKLIGGYMIRHKVPPGITGWAQVNGLRGETATVEKMRLRVQYDLEYLRNWSLRLDLQILLKTVLSVVRDVNAY
jgi:putative colanic acid biosynthesis UDP-glucose lipid carrier transferase